MELGIKYETEKQTRLLKMVRESVTGKKVE
jgi:hypothetical protein